MTQCPECQSALIREQAADRSDARFEAQRDADEGGCWLTVHALNGLMLDKAAASLDVSASKESRYWALVCQCCDGSGEHNEVPQRRSVEDTRNWPCQPCKGTGEFRIEIPR